MTKPGKRTLSPATIKAIAADFSPAPVSLAALVHSGRERLLGERALAWMKADPKLKYMVNRWELEL